MRDTRSGDRTADEAVRSGFAETAALTSSGETTTAPHTAEMNSTCNSENPVCHLNVHDSLTAADQHWLDFNLA